MLVSKLHFQIGAVMPVFILRLFLLTFIAAPALVAAQDLPATTGVAGKPRKFQLLTHERLALLEQQTQTQWLAYLKKSEDRFVHEQVVMSEECRQAGHSAPQPALSTSAQFEADAKKQNAWYASDEAIKLAETVISFQTPSGGWSKSVNYAAGPRTKGTHWTSQPGNIWHYCGTLDNRSTTEQIRFLAKYHSITSNVAAKDSALRGLEWMLEAQYPNGGWPQNYPVEPGYHEAITLNDDAMLHALELLQDVYDQSESFTFVPEDLRQRAREAYDRGLTCLSMAQVQVRGLRTVWCAQHDPLDLRPVAARKKEPPSLSGAESATLLKYLMRKGPINARTSTMIESGVQWLDLHRLTGLRKTTNSAGKSDYVADPSSTEVYWARFYDVQTFKPLFAGAQDGIVYDTFSEMASKNKVGYDYLTTKPGELIDKEMTRWKKRISK